MKEETTSIDETAAVEVAAMTPAETPKGISEKEIKEKTAVGLTRDQAIEVIKNQRDHDAAMAAANTTGKKPKEGKAAN